MIAGVFKFVLACFVFWFLFLGLNPMLGLAFDGYQVPSGVVFFACLFGAGWCCSPGK